MSHTFVDELPGDADTSNTRRQVIVQCFISCCFLLFFPCRAVAPLVGLHGACAVVWSREGHRWQLALLAGAANCGGPCLPSASVQADITPGGRL